MMVSNTKEGDDQRTHFTTYIFMGINPTKIINKKWGEDGPFL